MLYYRMGHIGHVASGGIKSGFTLLQKQKLPFVPDEEIFPHRFLQFLKVGQLGELFLSRYSFVCLFVVFYLLQLYVAAQSATAKQGER